VTRLRALARRLASLLDGVDAGVAAYVADLQRALCPDRISPPAFRNQIVPRAPRVPLCNSSGATARSKSWL
jgi:hypothetical protein